MDGERQIGQAIELREVDELAAFLKAVANPARLRILALLCEGDQQVSELESRLDLGQAYVSQQLARLRSAGLVTGDRHGREVRYRLLDPRTQPLVEFIGQWQNTQSNNGASRR
jgi:DNA-binding transcriptional ArsR family regulator